MPSDAAHRHAGDPAGDRSGGPVVLIIRDGWGENPHPEHDSFNAIKLAKTPVDDALRRERPSTLIRTSGEDVGLPPGTMGNSEVGHQNIGAGRIVDQELMRITRAVRDGSFFTNASLNAAIDHALATGGKLHLLGLVSDGQVHSDIEHLFALIDLAKRRGVEADRLMVHIITDGRDVGPKTGLGFIERLEAKLRETGVGRIATVTGRYFAMDRDHRWERTAWAYAALTGRNVQTSKRPNVQIGQVDKSTSQQVNSGEIGVPRATASALEAVQEYYDEPIDSSRTGDEFIPPTVVARSALGTQNSELISSGDAVIFFNFRGDRPRQLTRAFTLSDDEWKNVKSGGFDRGAKIDNLFFCTMTGYEEGLPVSAIAFEKPPKMANILGQVVAEAGLTQFRCAETEKFAHVTFFFNDYREAPFPGESRVLVPSPQDVSTYDRKPEMSAHGVCEAVLERLRAPDCESLIVVNFANPDMVGHTGKLDAVIRAVEVVDACVGKIVEATLARPPQWGGGGSLIITADHGNAEQMWNPETDSPHTAHTAYDVRLIVVSAKREQVTLREGGRLADLAPTALALLGMKQPAEMTGQSLLA